MKTRENKKTRKMRTKRMGCEDDDNRRRRPCNKKPKSTALVVSTGMILVIQKPCSLQHNRDCSKKQKTRRVIQTGGYTTYLATQDLFHLRSAI